MSFLTLKQNFCSALPIPSEHICLLKAVHIWFQWLTSFCAIEIISSTIFKHGLQWAAAGEVSSANIAARALLQKVKSPQNSFGSMLSKLLRTLVKPISWTIWQICCWFDGAVKQASLTRASHELAMLPWFRGWVFWDFWKTRFRDNLLTIGNSKRKYRAD